MKFIVGILVVITIFQWFRAENADAAVRELTTTANELVTSYNTLKANNEQWIANYNSLKANNEQWIANYNSLKANNEQWIANYNSLKANNEQWIANYNSLKANNASLTQIAEDNKFDFYYVKPAQQFGVETLDSFVKGRVWTKPYEENVFDCSEMSAALERTLENAGFHTTIVTGNTPGKPDTRHAWLLVETSAGKYMPVDATIPAVVRWDYPYFNDYYKYDREFETIREALKYSSTEFDWWKQ